MIDGNILVVDDNEINRIVAGAMVSSLGAFVTFANDGEEALAQCRAAPPRLVLMDVQMPQMNGIECTNRIRQLQAASELPSFPVIAMTAGASDHERSATSAAGMNEHLTKPFSLCLLKAALLKWMPASVAFDV